MRITEILNEAAEPIYYFAYGMLTDPNLMRGAVKVGPATLGHFKFELLQFANMRYEPGAVSHGALWAITRDRMSHLDRVEGYPKLYDRKTVPAYINDKKFVAELYTLTPESNEWLQGTVPDKAYIKKLVRGYQHFGLPLSQITEAFHIAVQNYKEPEELFDK